MLPSTLAIIDSDLNVLRTIDRLAPESLLKSGDGQSGGTRLLEKNYDVLFRNCLGAMEDLLRKSGDIAEDSKLKVLSEPGKQVLRIDLLLAEVGIEEEEFRRLVLVEDKLSKNAESRRAVLAQLLDYARIVQRKLTPDDLPKAIVSDEWIEDNSDDLGRSIRAGDYLLIICGDHIHDELLDLLRSYKDRLGPLNASNVIAIEMAIYRDGETNIFAPHIVGGTNRATRDLTIRIDVRATSGTPLDVASIDVQETPVGPGPRPAGVTPPAVFMANFTRKCGAQPAADWATFAEAVKGAGIPGIGIGNYDGGAPYIFLSNTPLGTVQLLRLADRQPTVRDRLNTPVWESTPEAEAARAKFRRALVDHLEHAAPGGKVDRVYAPVSDFMKQRTAVIDAITELADELRASAVTAAQV